MKGIICIGVVGFGEGIGRIDDNDAVHLKRLFRRHLDVVGGWRGARLVEEGIAFSTLHLEAAAGVAPVGQQTGSLAAVALYQIGCDVAVGGRTETNVNALTIGECGCLHLPAVVVLQDVPFQVCLCLGNLAGLAPHLGGEEQFTFDVLNGYFWVTGVAQPVAARHGLGIHPEVRTFHRSFCPCGREVRVDDVRCDAFAEGLLDGVSLGPFNTAKLGFCKRDILVFAHDIGTLSVNINYLLSHSREGYTQHQHQYSSCGIFHSHSSFARKNNYIFLFYNEKGRKNVAERLYLVQFLPSEELDVYVT